MMPTGHRSTRSRDSYRQALYPVTTPTTTTYAPISSRPTTSSMPNHYYGAPMSQPSYTQPQGYPTGGPVQQPLSSTHYSTSVGSLPTSLPPPLSSIRPSSGAWNPTDDQLLMTARAQGMNWAPIQQTYFPSKTPNACRKRHERLMERRSADDWDGIKLENLAKCYMGMRKEIWTGLAQQTGEKWNVVEQKCMSQGLKNLQQAARSCARRERMLDPNSNSMSNQLGGGGAYDPQHTDDSGIGIDDMEAEYDADGASEHSGGSNSNHSMGGGGGYAYQPQHQRYHSQGGHQSRLPSMDMGIDAIINRPGPR